MPPSTETETPATRSAIRPSTPASISPGPDVLLTYGGHPASREFMHRARTTGTAVVFQLHNFGYNDVRVRTLVPLFSRPSTCAGTMPPGRAGRGRHSRPDPPGQGRRARPGAELCDVHQSSARQGRGGIRPDRARARNGGGRISHCWWLKVAGILTPCRRAGRSLAAEQFAPDGQYARPGDF